MKVRSMGAGMLLFIFAFGANLAVEGNTVQPIPEEAQQESDGKTPEPDKAPEETEVTKPKKSWSVTYGGEITNYFISESSAFFGDHACQWLETSLRLDGTASSATLGPVLLRFSAKIPNVRRVSIINQTQHIIADSDFKLVGKLTDESKLVSLLQGVGQSRFFFERGGRVRVSAKAFHASSGADDAPHAGEQSRVTEKVA